MGWIFDTIAVVLLLIGALCAVENWRAWFYNTFRRKSGAPHARYYPLLGCIIIFYGLSLILRTGYELWAFLALVLDFGCIPLAIAKLWQKATQSK